MEGLVERAAVGDQDGDGKGEIIAVSYDGKVYVFESKQTPTNAQEIFEDFSVCNSDWVEYDPENKIEIDCTNDHRLEFDDWKRYEPAYVYRPFSTTDFVLEYDINITGDGGNANMIGPGFSDTLGTKKTIQNGAFAAYYAGFGGPQIDMQTFVNGSVEWDCGGWGDLPNRIWINTNTTYYVRFEKSGNVLTLSVFSDAARTQHISGSPKAVNTNLSAVTFNYFYAVNGPHADNPQANWEWTTGWLDNIYIEGQIPPTNTQEIFEDFSVCNSDWVEYDPENKIELDCTNDHRLEFNHWIRYEPGYVYRPFSTTDFVLEYDINITDHGGNGNVVGPGFSDTLGTLCETQNGIFSVFYAGWPGGGGVPHLDLMIYENGTQILDWKQFLDLRISTGTTYYLRVEKSGSNVTFSIFSDASRTNHISGSPKTFATNLTDTTFNYFYAVNGCHTSPQGNWEWTGGWIDNIHVRKEQIPGGDCINIGNLTLCADSISQSGNVYTLAGNVNINKNLWFSGNVTYTANSTKTGTLISTGYPYVKLSDGNQPLFTALDIEYNVDGAAGTLEPSNLNITNYELSLGNIPLSITSDPITIKNNGVLIGGRIVIGSEDSILCGVDVEVLYKTGDKAYLQKAELSADISSTIPGIETASIELNYDGEKDELTGTAKLDFPYLGMKEIEASIVVQSGCIDGFRISIALAHGIPLGSTGLQIVGLTMEVDNICSPTQFYIFFGGDVGAAGIPKDTFVLEGVGLGYEPLFTLNIEGGTARFLGYPVASLSGDVNASGDPNETGASLYGTVDFGGFYEAEIDLKLLAMLLEFNGNAVGILQIPDFDCDSSACEVIKTLIKVFISLPYPVANQYMDIDVSCENGNCNGSLKGMVSIGNLELAAALNYANNELNFSIGTNYEDMIQLSDSSQLRILSNSVEQPITFAANKEDVIFAAVGNTLQPQIYLNTPDGETITSSNVGNFSGVSYIESNKNLVTLFNLEHAAAGSWNFGVSNLPSSEVTIQILSKRPLPQTSFTRVNQSGDKIDVNVTVSPTEGDTKVSFYFSKRASGGTGSPIVENLSASSGSVSTVWNTGGISTGTYYIFAKTTDDVNPPIITYYTSPIVLNNSGIQPPTDLQGSRTGSTAALYWKPSTSPNVIGYNVLYTDEPYVGGYKYHKSTNYQDQAVIENLDPEKEYCFCVAAFDDNGNSSIESNKYCTSELGTPEISLNRTSLTFGAVSNGESTSPQRIFISNSQNGTLNWVLTSSESWLQGSPGSGTGDGEINISVNPIGLSAGTYTGTITIRDPNAANSPQPVTVTLNVYQASSTTGPFGEFATPVDNSTVMSSIPVTGWILDDIGVESVKIYRGKIGNLIYIGDAVLVEGARPDVEQAYPDYPMNYKAGWGYMMLTNFLPNGGNGIYTIYAKAVDSEGNQVTLGSKTITVDNANAVKPFGAIDTPTQGGTASGSSFINWGWVLTPLPNHIPTDGSTIDVIVDGVNIGHPVYNNYRSDIAALFPGYANSNGAIGYFYLDTTTYENGVHTIQWTAADSAGNSDGIGSRYFTIRNTGESKASLAGYPSGNANRKTCGEQARLFRDSIRDIPNDYSRASKIRKGYKKDIKPQEIYPDEKGDIHIEIRELERVEIDLGCPQWRGYHVIGHQLRPLPVGSTLDSGRGIFYWQPGPGFIGEYQLVFIVGEENGEFRKRIIKITVAPKFKN